MTSLSRSSSLSRSCATSRLEPWTDTHTGQLLAHARRGLMKKMKNMMTKIRDLRMSVFSCGETKVPMAP